MQPQEFVKKVYHVQEGVIFQNLYPTSNKYQEVLLHANSVLVDLARTRDWNFLRRTLIAGDTHPEHYDNHRPMQIQLPDDVDRPSVLFNDAIKLVSKHHMGDTILVPIASRGNTEFHHDQLVAKIYGNVIEFNRRLRPYELRREVQIDVQMKPKEIHVCNESCVGQDKDKSISYTPGPNYNPCPKALEPILLDIPDKDYIILKTASLNAEYSDIAQAYKMDLEARCKNALSALNRIDSAKTVPDIVKQKKVFKFINGV